jgi:hypothetical protein
MKKSMIVFIVLIISVSAISKIFCQEQPEIKNLRVIVRDDRPVSVDGQPVDSIQTDIKLHVLFSIYKPEDFQDIIINIGTEQGGSQLINDTLQVIKEGENNIIRNQQRNCTIYNNTALLEYSFPSGTQVRRNWCDFSGRNKKGIQIIDINTQIR